MATAGTRAGWRWLAERYGAEPVQPLPAVSGLPSSGRPAPDLQGQLTFAFKHERLHLELLARLLARIEPVELEEWIRREPTGQYARRAGFFFEWLTGRALAVPDTAAGNYVDAIDAGAYLTSTSFIAVKRWRVRNNLPGTRLFCPVVSRSPEVRAAEAIDFAHALAELESAYGLDILQRSAVWLTIRESRASFAIEHEESRQSRIQRFAATMESQCGRAEDPLALDSLAALQASILGPAATRYGLRRSPVFVGHLNTYSDVVDYIAPHWDETLPLLEGLRASLACTAGQPPAVRAAVAAFGFVYIHPMSDGNGRISRFLINDILRRDGAVPAPFILPVSASIARSAFARAVYDQTLEVFSRPLMRKYAQQYQFGAMTEYEDGVRSNFQFGAYEDAMAAWRYPDLSEHAAYLGGVLRHTLDVEMPDEAAYLRGVYNARREVKNWLEGPDTEIDRIVRAVRENGWAVSNKLKKEFPMLADTKLAGRIEHAVQAAFSPGSAR